MLTSQLLSVIVVRLIILRNGVRRLWSENVVGFDQEVPRSLGEYCQGDKYISEKEEGRALTQWPLFCPVVKTQLATQVFIQAFLLMSVFEQRLSF